MDDTLNKGMEVLKRQKFVIFVIAGVVVIVVLFLISLLVSASRAPQSHQNVPVTPQPTAQETTSTGQSDTTTQPTVLPSGSATTQNQWLPYTSPIGNYTIQYPTDWTKTVSQVTGGGELVRFAPSELPAGVNYPYIAIETDPGTTTPIENRASLLQGLGFTQSNATVDGVSAIKMTGTLPTMSYGGTTINSPSQNGTLFLERNGTQYVVKYEYADAKIDQNMDDFFMAFINTLKFNK